MSIPVDYDILRVIWWLFLGVLLIGFAIMDGFDLGVATLLPFVARTETERRVAINTIGPVWDGNQVWLITGGGAVFAAFPQVCAASRSETCCRGCRSASIVTWACCMKAVGCSSGSIRSASCAVSFRWPC